MSPAAAFSGRLQFRDGSINFRSTEETQMLALPPLHYLVATAFVVGTHPGEDLVVLPREMTPAHQIVKFGLDWSSVSPDRLELATERVRTSSAHLWLPAILLQGLMKIII